MAVSVRVEATVHGDWRYARLGKLVGAGDHAHAAGLGYMIPVWAHCTKEQTDLVDADTLAGLTGVEGFAEHLCGARLGDIQPDGHVRVRGCEGRIEWYARLKAGASKGGKNRANLAQRQPDGKLMPADSQPTASRQLAESPATSQPEAQPAASAIAIVTATAIATAKKQKKAGALDKHRVEAERLWALQDDLRAKSLPGSRPLKATDECLGRVADRLEQHSSADCEHVLRVYAEEGTSWFDGVTNWRPENFARALGRTLKAAKPRTAPEPTYTPPPAIPAEEAQEAVSEAMAKLRAKFGQGGE